MTGKVLSDNFGSLTDGRKIAETIKNEDYETT